MELEEIQDDWKTKQGLANKKAKLDKAPEIISANRFITLQDDDVA